MPSRLHPGLQKIGCLSIFLFANYFNFIYPLVVGGRNGGYMSKFFTYEERLDLQKYLKESLSFKEIARRVGKDLTAISREVRKYSSEVATGHPGFPFNAYKNRFNCRKKNICGNNCSRKSAVYCKLCARCNNNCNDFIEEICTARFRVPYVCNGCENIRNCTLLKSVYDAEHAHIKASDHTKEKS
ncbi:helix-turn-helix domain-containing protein [Clostridium sp. Mt-5]|uniref:Helix-turn-helix domain-containing protein n=1 Tax=Clostridium moutaii TaxID=3240932 RepID=A0ABV4BT94_9CLOT